MERDTQDAFLAGSYGALKPMIVGGLVALVGAIVVRGWDAQSAQRAVEARDTAQTRVEMAEDAYRHMEQAGMYRDSMEAAEEGIFNTIHGGNTRDRSHSTFLEVDLEAGVAYLRLDSLYHKARERSQAITDSLDQDLVRTFQDRINDRRMKARRAYEKMTTEEFVEARGRIN